MTNSSFGLTMLVVGMGGTLATLWLLTGLLRLLTRVFPTETKPVAPAGDTDHA